VILWYFSDAIESARQSNADALEALKKRLDGINENIVYLDDYQKKLDEENAVLQWVVNTVLDIIHSFMPKFMRWLDQIFVPAIPLFAERWIPGSKFKDLG